MSSVAFAEAPPRWAHAYFQLTKPRITLMVVLTTLIGFLAGSRNGPELALLLHALGGTAAVAAAASALNQFMERGPDGLMRRTMARPLPAGLLAGPQALAFGLVLLVLGVAWLSLAVNVLAGAIALLTAVSYLLLYTPLKRRTWLATIIGAVPGALPPVIGWAAARNAVEAGAVTLFLIMFLWQMPHFFAIAALFRDDYSRGGFRVLPVTEPDGRSTGRQAFIWATLLLPVTVLPPFIGLASWWYLVPALPLALLFLASSMRFMTWPAEPARARNLFRWSLVYLPVIFILLVVA